MDHELLLKFCENAKTNSRGWGDGSVSVIQVHQRKGAVCCAGTEGGWYRVVAGRENREFRALLKEHNGIVQYKIKNDKRKRVEAGGGTRFDPKPSQVVEKDKTEQNYKKLCFERDFNQ